MTTRPSVAFVVTPEDASADTERKQVLFFRNYRRFTGGHLKAWDYYNHVAASATYMPCAAFAPGSVWDDTNPWKREGQRVVSAREIRSPPDVYFLAGKDWSSIDGGDREDSSVPIINFIQHVRHADPRDGRYSYLAHRAIRICVSREVAGAIEDSGRARGPIFTIPNGIDDAGLRAAHPEVERDVDVLIIANKQPDLGARMERSLSAPGRRVRLIDRLVTRVRLLNELRRARITLFLPREAEGFYMPALEGMALGTLVVCPDCVGNRSFCIPDHNALRPPYTYDDVLEAVRTALDMPEPQATALVEAGAATARDHDVSIERKRFLEILNNVDDLWLQGG